MIRAALAQAETLFDHLQVQNRSPRHVGRLVSHDAGMLEEQRKEEEGSMPAGRLKRREKFLMRFSLGLVVGVEVGVEVEGIDDR